jgi:hypothetical protein
LASISRRATASMSFWSARIRIGTSNNFLSITAALPSARSTLSGMARNTGPPGGVAANLSARRTVSGIPATDCACQYHLVSGASMFS